MRPTMPLLINPMTVLFICNGNVARSQEAEIFFNALAGSDHRAISAGVNPKPGKPIDPVVVRVMQEAAFSMAAAQRKPVTPVMAASADLVVSFKPAAELPEAVLSSGKSIRYWDDIADPQGQSLEFHRQTRDAVERRVRALVDEIALGNANQASDCHKSSTVC